MNDSTQLVAFTLDNCKFALPLPHIERIVNVIEITPLPISAWDRHWRCKYTRANYPGCWSSQAVLPAEERNEPERQAHFIAGIKKVCWNYGWLDRRCYWIPQTGSNHTGKDSAGHRVRWRCGETWRWVNHTVTSKSFDVTVIVNQDYSWDSWMPFLLSSTSRKDSISRGPLNPFGLSSADMFHRTFLRLPRYSSSASWLCHETPLPLFRNISLPSVFLLDSANLLLYLFHLHTFKLVKLPLHLRVPCYH